MDDDAVSPVIAVIMMIAITVVLAGVIVVLVQGLRSGEEPATGIAITRSEGDDELRIAGSNAVDFWEDYEFRTQSAVVGLHWAVDQDATGTDPTVSQEYVALTGGKVQAGDRLHFCADSALADVTILIRDAQANAVVYQGTFRSIAAC